MERIDGWELGDFMQRSLLGSAETNENDKGNRLKHKKVLI